MLKSSNVYAFGVFLLIVSVNGDFLGIQTRSSTSNLPEEPSLSAEQGTTEGSSDGNYKSSTSSDITTKSSGAISSTQESTVNVAKGISGGYQNNSNEDNVTDNPTCGQPLDLEEATAPDVDEEEHAIGKVIKYQCKIGYVSRIPGGFKSVCEFDETTGKAEWTKPEVSCSPRSCGDPGYVTNGRRIGNLFTFPNKIEFECDEGYKLKGLKSRYCQARGEWSGRRLPTCELIHCSEPANPVNGRVSYSSLGYGSELRYECNRGFVLKNHVTRVCTADGEWSDEEPDCIEVTCEKPLPPERGSVQFSDGQSVGSIATYLCEEGTTLVGVSSSKCLENGVWTFDPPKCLRSCIIPEIENGVIGVYKTVQKYRRTHQEFVQLQVGETVKPGESVVLSCQHGFIPVNLTTSRNGYVENIWCREEVWSKSMQCAPSKCLGEPPPMENGYPVVKNDSNGSVIWYTCKKGFEKLKGGHVECAYGTWKGYTPVCGDTRCFIDSLNYPGLKLPTTEYITSNRSFDINCEAGYDKTSPKKKIRCSKGKWDVESNPCTISDQNGCYTNSLNSPGLKLPEAEYFGNNGNFDISCEEGYRKASPKNKIRCSKGKWDIESNPCTISDQNRCYTNSLNYPGLTLPAEEIFENNWSFDIRCEEGYSKTPSENRISCLQGKWEVKRNPCTISKCEGEPPPIQNGRIESFDRDQGSEVRYRCYENFEILQESSVICNRGKWEGDPPQCLEVGQIHNHEIGPVPQNNLDREQHSSTTEVPSSSTPSVIIDSCYCTYDYPPHILAYSRNREVVDGKRLIKKGETVSLRCQYEGMDIVWNNGLAFHGALHPTVNLTCDTCKNWSRNDLPLCRYREQADSFLIFSNDMRILPGGIIEIPRHANVSFECINLHQGPAWNPNYISGTYVSEVRYDGRFHRTSLQIIDARNSHAQKYDCYAWTSSYVYRTTSLVLKIADFEIQCPLLEKNTNRGTFNIQYENNRKVHSVAKYACQSRTQKLLGTNSRECMPNGQWSGSYPSCEDITCPWINTYNSLVITYTNGNKLNSVATFRCGRNVQLIGKSSAICRHNGQWSNPKPTCEMLEIRCPALNGEGIFSIYYDGDRKIGSIAVFHCIGESLKVSGCAFWTCQKNGEWSGDYPTCVDYHKSCDLFKYSENLEVFYHNNAKVGSTATFSCVSPYKLVGSHQSKCLQNGSWNHALPSCEIPQCSIESLSQNLPEDLYADLRNVTEDYVPYGTELPLVCNTGSFLSGGSTTKCGEQELWEHGNVRCTEACILGETRSKLLVEPLKDHYPFGESITFSCPPGQKLSSETQRVMCLGTSWSDPIPECVDAPEANP